LLIRSVDATLGGQVSLVKVDATLAGDVSSVKVDAIIGCYLVTFLSMIHG
jgi:hypothetical protein